MDISPTIIETNNVNEDKNSSHAVVTLAIDENKANIVKKGIIDFISDLADAVEKRDFSFLKVIAPFLRSGMPKKAGHILSIIDSYARKKKLTVNPLLKYEEVDAKQTISIVLTLFAKIIETEALASMNRALEASVIDFRLESSVFIELFKKGKFMDILTSVADKFKQDIRMAVLFIVMKALEYMLKEDKDEDFLFLFIKDESSMSEKKQQKDLALIIEKDWPEEIQGRAYTMLKLGYSKDQISEDPNLLFDLYDDALASFFSNYTDVNP